MNNPSLPLDQVLVGDCLEILPTLPAESVDLIFADPPYNLQLQQELWRPNQTRVDGVVEAWDRFDSFAAYDDFTRKWLSACRRVLKKNGTLWVIGSYHNIYRVGSILQDLDYWILNDIAWIKTNPMPNFHGVRFTNAHETLLWAQKERGESYTFNYHSSKTLNDDLQMRSDWHLPICSGKERLKVNGKKAHPTQKPEALLYRILVTTSNPGDVVLDPFFGTGTTGAVARRLHRRWIGIERSSDYASLADDRTHTAIQPEFDPPLYVAPNPRAEERIPFGTLLENDLLRPGDLLFPDMKNCAPARILSDGALEFNGQRGSIHQIARLIRQSPINGWDFWFYADRDTGQRLCINTLREQVRRTLKQEAAASASLSVEGG
ncbi:MAG TPA: DNA methyltransferase [Anaerolineaceae bacterium]|nr:DNA methyltransferase [Anaerolineaceae bacterium]HPN51510.1 DNA methyltransferase [Anaerolineaceae bacterium]